jgi:pimeloyl-ACP methyl ester carboxylesterase
VIAEASPDPDTDAPAAVASWLAEWPQPFASRDEALTFFGDSRWGQAWAGGLERRPDGYWAAFDPEVMVQTMQQAAQHSYWNDWCSIVCPVLVVRGERGMSVEVAERMVEELPTARLVTLSDAGHDLHLEQADQWIQAVDDFIA